MTEPVYPGQAYIRPREHFSGDHNWIILSQPDAGKVEIKGIPLKETLADVEEGVPKFFRIEHGVQEWCSRCGCVGSTYASYTTTKNSILIKVTTNYIMPETGGGSYSGFGCGSDKPPAKCSGVHR